MGSVDLVAGVSRNAKGREGGGWGIWILGLRPGGFGEFFAGLKIQDVGKLQILRGLSCRIK